MVHPADCCVVHHSDIALKGNIDTLSASEVRAINYRDFCMAMRQVDHLIIISMIAIRVELV